VVRNALALYLLHPRRIEVKNSARLACSIIWARELRRSPATGFVTRDPCYALNTRREGPKHARVGIYQCANKRLPTPVKEGPSMIHSALMYERQCLRRPPNSASSSQAAQRLEGSR